MIRNNALITFPGSDGRTLTPLTDGTALPLPPPWTDGWHRESVIPAPKIFGKKLKRPYNGLDILEGIMNEVDRLRPHACYRCFAVDGTLVYVGASINALKRLEDHRYSSSWVTAVVRIELSWYPTREAAFAAEHEIIAAEKPLFNLHKIHNPGVCTRCGQALAWRGRKRQRSYCRRCANLAYREKRRAEGLAVYVKPGRPRKDGSSPTRPLVPYRASD
jgi:hypothetical protein